MARADVDVIDELVGIAPGSALDAIRARRPEARTHAQASYRALFAPESAGGVSAAERFAVAPGRQTAIFTTNDSGYGLARDLEAAGLAVSAIIDSRSDVKLSYSGKARVIKGAVVSDEKGG